MPFDGTTTEQRQHQLYQHQIYLDSVRARQRSYRRQRRQRYACSTAMMIFLVAAGVSLLSEIFIPNAGIITRIMYGNTVANRNWTGRSLITNAKFMSFDIVGGGHYIVTAQMQPLTDYQRSAIIGYAKWEHLPLYSVDGPYAVDP